MNDEPASYILCLLNLFIKCSQTSGALVSQAGCILQSLDEFVAPKGFLMPLVRKYKFESVRREDA